MNSWWKRQDYKLFVKVKRFGDWSNTSYYIVIVRSAIFGQEVDLWHSSLQKQPVLTRSRDCQKETIQAVRFIDPIANSLLIYCSVQRRWTLQMQSEAPDSPDNSEKSSGEPRGNLSQQRLPPKANNLQMSDARWDNQAQGSTSDCRARWLYHSRSTTSYFKLNILYCTYTRP
jgi:hypothetical protein